MKQKIKDYSAYFKEYPAAGVVFGISFIFLATLLIGGIYGVLNWKVKAPRVVTKIESVEVSTKYNYVNYHCIVKFENNNIPPTEETIERGVDEKAVYVGERLLYTKSHDLLFSGIFIILLSIVLIIVWYYFSKDVIYDS